MKQSARKHGKKWLIALKKPVAPKTNPKILRTPPTEHQTIPQTALSPTAPPKRIKKFEHQTTRTTPCPTAPPKTNPKNLQTLTPRLEVRTPMAQAIWGKTSLFDLFSWFLCKIYPAKITASDLLMFVGGTSNRFFWGPRKGWFKATRS